MNRRWTKVQLQRSKLEKLLPLFFPQISKEEVEVKEEEIEEIEMVVGISKLMMINFNTKAKDRINNLTNPK